MDSQIKRAVDFIERHMGEDFPFDAPAREGGLSYYHFCRYFTAMTGMSPGLYTRRRRLSIAAVMLRDTKASVVDIALDAGFETHEAFTRAFKSMFGLNPRDFRQSDADYYHLQQPVFDESFLNHILSQTITLKPEERSLKETLVTGLQSQFTIGDDPHELNKLWQQFNARQAEIDPDLKCAEAYGVCMSGYQGALIDSRFQYIAGLAVGDVKRPDDMVTQILPAATYWVYTHDGPLAKMKDTIAYIWGVSLPKNKKAPIHPIDFELYDERFDVETLSGQIEIWIPVAD